MEECEEDILVRSFDPLLGDKLSGRADELSAECAALQTIRADVQAIGLSKIDRPLVGWLDDDRKSKVVQFEKIGLTLDGGRAWHGQTMPFGEFLKLRLVAQCRDHIRRRQLDSIRLVEEIAML